jgi:hypothetical protein
MGELSLGVKLAVSLYGNNIVVFENGASWRLFGVQRVEMPGGWRKRYNEEFIICTLLQTLLL